MSLTAWGNFMDPIVAGRAGGRLETLVPIVGALTGDEHEDARNWQTLGRRDVALGDSGARQAVSSPEARASE